LELPPSVAEQDPLPERLVSEASTIVSTITTASDSAAKTNWRADCGPNSPRQSSSRIVVSDVNTDANTHLVVSGLGGDVLRGRFPGTDTVHTTALRIEQLTGTPAVLIQLMVPEYSEEPLKQHLTLQQLADGADVDASSELQAYMLVLMERKYRHNTS
jgi:hypothetical protein